jgi:hypothetical protein
MRPTLSRAQAEKVWRERILFSSRCEKGVDVGSPASLLRAFLPCAQMAELVDALRSGRSSRKGVAVRVLFCTRFQWLSR